MTTSAPCAAAAAAVSDGTCSDKHSWHFGKVPVLHEYRRHDDDCPLAGPDLPTKQALPGCACPLRFPWHLTPANVADCQAPRLLTCQRSSCKERLVLACDKGDASKCPPCAERYKRRVRVVIQSPMLLARPGSMIFVTLTAPGRSNGHKDTHGNVCPCNSTDLTSPAAVAAWNGTSGRRFNDFITDLRRLSAFRGAFRRAEYARAVEAQDRGALHEHFIVRVDGTIEVRRRLKALLKQLALRHGYGCQVKIELVANGRDDAHSIRKAANYLAKYTSKAVESRPNVPWQRSVGSRRRRSVPASAVGPYLEALPDQPSLDGSDSAAAREQHVVALDVPSGAVADSCHGTDTPRIGRGQRGYVVHLTRLRRRPDGRLVRDYRHSYTVLRTEPVHRCNCKGSRVSPWISVKAYGPRSYRNWTCSRRWGSSMGLVKAVQADYMRNKADFGAASGPVDVVVVTDAYRASVTPP